MSGSFFDFRERYQSGKGKSGARISTGTSGGGTTGAGDDGVGGRIYTVGELTGTIASAIRAGTPAVLRVRGELSNVNVHRGSGHIYFTLKDDKSCIDGVMFRDDAAGLTVLPTDGDETIVEGAIRVYIPRGKYQLYATQFSPVGRGALEIRFQQLKHRLEAEGLFHPRHKKVLPRYPLRIGLVTSRQAAAYADVLKVLRRFGHLKITLHDVPVQSGRASERIADGIRQADDGGRYDLIIVTRGGGSLEDLWAFNEEAVVRAIAGCATPVVTGIGHETDVSICDWVADHHAHTPTEAAVVVTRGWTGADTLIVTAGGRLRRLLEQSLSVAKTRTTSAGKHEFFRRRFGLLNERRQRVDELEKRLLSTVVGRTAKCERRVSQLSISLNTYQPRALVRAGGRQIETLERLLKNKMVGLMTSAGVRIDSRQAALGALNPLGVLGRGYSITSDKRTGKIIRSSSEVQRGQKLVTRIGDGEFESTAGDIKQPDLFD